MKKLTAFVLILVCVLGMVGCEEPDGAEATAANITEGILDGGADIGIDAGPEDGQTTQGTTDEILNGTLDGGADIALDATP